MDLDIGGDKFFFKYGLKYSFLVFFVTFFMEWLLRSIGYSFGLSQEGMVYFSGITPFFVIGTALNIAIAALIYYFAIKELFSKGGKFSKYAYVFTIWGASFAIQIAVISILTQSLFLTINLNLLEQLVIALLAALLIKRGKKKEQ